MNDDIASSTLSAGTHVYRTTLTQRFMEVTHPDWSIHTGPGAQIIDIDAARECQTFRGIGGSFAEASCFTLMRMAETERARAFEMLFGKSGLGLSIARIHCGSSDYSVHLYSYDDVAGDTALEHFSIDDDRRWVIPAIREALKVNPDIFFFSSPWSAPGWMKENGTLCGSRLRSDMFGVYADYVVRFLKAYREEGIVIGAHSPQNEVLAQQVFDSPTLLMPAEDEARFVKELKPRLASAGLDVRIWILDHNYEHLEHVKTVLATPGVRECVDGIAWHTYGGSPESVAWCREAYPELENIHTEQGQDIYGKRDIFFWSERVLRGINCGLTGFTNWCLALDENGQPNVSCGFPCAGLIAVHSETGEIIPSHQYEMFRHVSPYVRPGAKVLNADIVTGIADGGAANRVKNSYFSVFRNADGSHVVVIAHPSDDGGQYMLKLHDRYLPVVLLANSLTTVVVADSDR